MPINMLFWMLFHRLEMQARGANPLCNLPLANPPLPDEDGRRCRYSIGSQDHICQPCFVMYQAVTENTSLEDSQFFIKAQSEYLAEVQRVKHLKMGE
jgi:hypothetical protein